MMIINDVGDASKFSVECGISRVYEKLSQRALGYFIIKIGGMSFGVRAPDATLLACSLDAVERRLMRRGAHCMGISVTSDALKIAESVLAVLYDEVDLHARFFNLSWSEFREDLIRSEVLWAPDGDAAFDDGGHVLQFDVGDRVRLIAFMNFSRREDVASSLTEVWMSADEFYKCLDTWQRQFKIAWNTELKSEKNNSDIPPIA